MYRQRGVSLSGLLMWCFVLIMVALLGIKVVPATIEYMKIKKDVKTVADAAGDKTVGQIRSEFDRYADIDDFDVISSKDIEISKQGGQVVISFSYEKRIPLVANASLVLDFSSSSDQ
jgi:hypothetical protein